MIRLHSVILGLGCCLAATVSAQSVKVNWKMNAPFSDYKTYSWNMGKQQGSGFYRQWVHQYVDDAMAKKGLRKVAGNQNPDLLVVYNMAGQEVLDSTTTTDGFGWGGGWGGGWGAWGGWGGGGFGPDISTTEQEPRMMGILTVDLVDAKKKQMIWRGQATEDNISNTQKGDEKQVEKSVQKMFDRYPPKNGK